MDLLHFINIVITIIVIACSFVDIVVVIKFNCNFVVINITTTIIIIININQCYFTILILINFAKIKVTTKSYYFVQHLLIHYLITFILIIKAIIINNEVNLMFIIINFKTIIINPINYFSFIDL